MTPEGRVLTAVGLVLSAFFANGMFQFLAFFLGDTVDSFGSRTLQYLLYSAPSGALATAGAVLAWKSRGTPLSPNLRGLAIGAVVIGSLVAGAVTLSIVAAYTVGPEMSF
jgi:hypothetical protein